MKTVERLLKTNGQQLTIGTCLLNSDNLHSVKVTMQNDKAMGDFFAYASFKVTPAQNQPWLNREFIVHYADIDALSVDMKRIYAVTQCIIRWEVYMIPPHTLHEQSMRMFDLNSIVGVRNTE